MIKRVLAIPRGVESIGDVINDFISNYLRENEYVIDVMNDGEKIETVVTASIINYLQVTHNNSEEFDGMIFATEINGREIFINDIDYFMG